VASAYGDDSGALFPLAITVYGIDQGLGIGLDEGSEQHTVKAQEGARGGDQTCQSKYPNEETSREELKSHHTEGFRQWIGPEQGAGTQSQQHNAAGQ
jgi:hypothetical protein